MFVLQRRSRGIDVRLSDARLAELDEVSNRLRKLLQLQAAQRGPRGRGHWSRRSPPSAPSAGLHKDKAREGPAAGAESEPQHCQPPGHVEGSAWVRLRELVRKTVILRFDCIGSALWLQLLVYRRRREAGDAPAIIVRLKDPEVMDKEWGVDIAVFPSLRRPLDLFASGAGAEAQHTAALKTERAAAALMNALLNDESGRISPQPACSRMHTGFRV